MADAELSVDTSPSSLDRAVRAKGGRVGRAVHSMNRGGRDAGHAPRRPCCALLAAVVGEERAGWAGKACRTQGADGDARVSRIWRQHSPLRRPASDDNETRALLPVSGAKEDISSLRGPSGLHGLFVHRSAPFCVHAWGTRAQYAPSQDMPPISIVTCDVWAG